MRITIASLILLSLAAIPAFPAIPAHAEVTVTAVYSLKDAQADYDAGRYPQALQKISTILSAADRPSAKDKAALLKLKAETILQQKQIPSAAEAFTAAATAYYDEKKPAPATDDKKAAATCTAIAALLKNSSNMQYTPKTSPDSKTDKTSTTKPAADKTDKTPISVLDLSLRSQALNAFYNDQLAADEPTYKTVLSKPALQPIVDFAPKLKELSDDELGATGSTAKTDPMLKALSTHAKTSIDNALAQWKSSVDSIAASASSWVDVSPQQSVPAGGKKGKAAPKQPTMEREKGLTDANRNSLNDTIANIDKLAPATKSLSDALDLPADFFKTETTEAAALRKKAEATLNATYNRTRTK